MSDIRFGVLGPLAVWAPDGQLVDVPERKVRMLLIDLLLHAGQPVSPQRLIADLWGDDPPGNPANTLQTKISQLRRALAPLRPAGGDDLLVFRPAGYLLRAGADQVDADRFRRLCAEAAHAGERRTAADLLTSALALWRGQALADAATEPFAQPAIARLQEQRLVALEQQAEARLELGEHAALAGELADLVARHPLRERLRAAHIRALYGAGRQSEALDSFQDLRDRLSSELGLDPGPEVTALHTAVLRHEIGPVPPASQPPPTNLPVPPASQPPPTNLPVPLTELIGRDEAREQVRQRLRRSRLVTLTGPAGVGKTRLALAVATGLPHPPGGAWLVELAALPPIAAPAATPPIAAPAAPASGMDMAAMTTTAIPKGKPGRETAGLDTRPEQEVAGAIAAVLGVRDDAASTGAGTAGADDLTDRLVRAVRSQELLLVMDNCEHVIEPVADLLGRLLAAAPGLAVLATSREPLGVPGEEVCAVPPLDLPPEVGADPGATSPAGAVELFLARAAAAAPGFQLTSDNTDAVATICRRLDGIPLALELAASRVRSINVHELAGLLDDRFRVLAAGTRGVSPRQRTLRATIDWSWQLLSAPEQAVLRRLAVHAEGGTIASAQAVCAGDPVPAGEVPALLSRLVDKSLVVTDAGGGGRYRMLESVTAYCLERLAGAGEVGICRDRHLAHYLSLAESAAPALRGRTAPQWLRRLDAEAANLRAALEHAIGSGAATSALRLAGALAWHWFLRGRLREGVSWLARARAVAGDAGDPAAARAGGWHAGLAMLAGLPRVEPHERVLARFDGLDDRAGRATAEWLLAFAEFGFGDLATSEELVARAQSTFDAIGDEWGVAACLSVRANQAIFRNDLAALREHGERCAAMFAALGDGWGRLQATEALGVLSEVTGDYGAGAQLYQEGLRIAEELALSTAVSAMLSRLGRVALLTGDLARADDLHERARRLAVTHSHTAGEEFAGLGLALSARRQGRLDEAEAILRRWLDWNRQVEAQYGVALILAELGFVAEQRGDARAAQQLHREGLAAAQDTGDLRAVALALEGLAGAEALAGRAGAAGLLLGAADAARRSAGAPLPPAERADVDRITARAVGAMGADEFSEVLARGGRLRPGEALAVVMGGTSAAVTPG